MAKPAANQSTFFIGVTGPARVGKNTVTDIITKELNSTAYKRGFDKVVGHYSFAAPIKDACQRMFGWTSRHTDGDLKETVTDLGFSPREAMQRLGTEWGRGLSSSLWIDLAKRNAPKCRFVLISDVRFNDEADFIRDYGALIHIDQGNRKLKPINGLFGHISERGVTRKREDYFTFNQSDIPTLEDDVHVILDNILDEMITKGQLV